MKVYKFGGASVKDAEGIRNVWSIMLSENDENCLVVVSAMGKTTNALERLCREYVDGKDTVHNTLAEIKNYHNSVLEALFDGNDKTVFDDIANTFIEIEWMLEDEPHPDYDFNYDQLVSIGELLSSKIVNAFLQKKGLNSKWIDARGFIHTDNTYREGHVDWEKSTASILELKNMLSTQVIVTQGFIGGTSENFTTTLGREGSDYSAAIFATALRADSLTIWKDVPGVLNSDPKLFANCIKYDELPYSEALEMTYYGATVIHPKTIKPLQNAGIPLFVKPFLAPGDSGTRIDNNARWSSETEAIILKQNQVLLSVSSRDNSFINEEILSALFKALSECRIKVNMMQVSALSFSMCFDNNEQKFQSLLKKLNVEYRLLYNTGLELVTVRHYQREKLADLLKGKEVILEQFSRSTAQFVLK